MGRHGQVSEYYEPQSGKAKAKNKQGQMKKFNLDHLNFTAASFEFDKDALRYWLSVGKVRSFDTWKGKKGQQARRKHVAKRSKIFQVFGQKTRTLQGSSECELDPESGFTRMSRPRSILAGRMARIAMSSSPTVIDQCWMITARKGM